MQEAQAVLLDLQVICASAYKVCHCQLCYGNTISGSKLPLNSFKLASLLQRVGCWALHGYHAHLLQRNIPRAAPFVAVLVQEYANIGSSSSGWSAWLAPRLLARGITMSSLPHHRPVSPGRQSPTPRPTSALRRAGSHNRCGCHLDFAFLLQQHGTGLHAMLMAAKRDLGLMSQVTP